MNEARNSARCSYRAAPTLTFPCSGASEGGDIIKGGVWMVAGR